MTSSGGVWVAMVVIAAQASWGAARAMEPRRLACLTDPETREAMQGQKAISPTKAVAEALQDGGGETVAIHLCRAADAALVYDVAVLRRDGRLVHVIVDARTGTVQPARKQP